MSEETRPMVHAFGSGGEGGIIRMVTLAERREALAAIQSSCRGSHET